MSKILENLLYTKDHEWVKVEDSTAFIGITDFAQSSLGDIVFVEVPEEGSEVQSGESFGVVESIKSVSDLYSPLSGKVLEKNSEIENNPERINENSFDAWLIKIEIANNTELEALMDHSAYKSFCDENQ